MQVRLLMLVLLILGATDPATYAAEKHAPVVDGPEGRRAFDQLAAYYQDNDQLPAYADALRELEAPEPAKRAAAGKYLLALFQQSYADESNGRARWQQLPFWGGGARSAAREFRKQLANEFGDQAKTIEAREAALWLLESEQLAVNQTSGARVLARIDPPVTDVFAELLQQPHPNEEACVAVIESVGKHKVKDFAPDMKRLSTHYRKTVREAARKAAAELAVEDVPEFAPESAFTPWLASQMEEIARMVSVEIPKDAQWVDVTVTYPPFQEGQESVVEEFSGWLIEQDETYSRFVDQFGGERLRESKVAKVTPSTLADEAQRLLKIRAGDAAAEQLSRQGGLTGQFEPGFISVREALVAAWCFQRGDKATAANIIFSRIDATADDRWVVWAVRDMLGHGYHQAMLRAFAYDRDYDAAIRLADHLSRPVFEEYQYQQRAKQLGQQLKSRQDDFTKLALPTPGDWQQLRQDMSRADQVEYLASRLRLLNCFQWGQPGGVSYHDPQYRDARGQTWWQAKEEPAVEVINPYVELSGMKLEVRDLPTLVPDLADDNFMPTFSYWRDFHPSRTLHQVNWLVAELINDAAKRDLAQLEVYTALDEAGRRRHLAGVTQWCLDNAELSRQDLLLKTLLESKNAGEFEQAAAEAATERIADALPVIVQRMDEFETRQGDLIKLCYHLDSADAVPHARRWLHSEDEDARFWASLILLRHGNKQQAEGLRELAGVLEEDDGSYWYPRAIEPLLATKNDEALTLACGILQKERFEVSDFEANPILHRLLLAGRQEALDYLVAQLSSNEASGTIYGTREGKEISQPLQVGDRAADIITDWRTDGVAFDELAPQAERQAARRALAKWIQDQFSLIKAGKESSLRAQPNALYFSEWQLDAP